MDRIRRWRLLARIWFWAAVRSPYFDQCVVYVSRPPVRLAVHFVGRRSEILLIQISLHTPKLVLEIPWAVCREFEIARKQAGENIDIDLLDDIPF